MANVTVFLAPYYHTVAVDKARPYCLNYQNSSGELAATRLVHDKKGRVNKGMYQQILGGRSSTNVQEFDKGGRVVRKTRQYNDGAQSEETFSYGKDGELKKESFKDSSGLEGSAKYLYDSDGNAHKMVCENHKGWLTAELKFTFDDDGKRIGGLIFQDKKETGKITYQYDGDGNLTGESWVMQGGWSQSFQYVYESTEK